MNPTRHNSKYVKETIRLILMSHLPRRRYAQMAHLYNKVIAKLTECHCNKKHLDKIISCGYPLIYISQPARSGGTLLRNLFDGHRECFVFPHELGWQANGFHFDDSLNDIQDKKRIYKKLFDRWLYHAFVNGLDKLYPFHFSITLLRKLFLNPSLKIPDSTRYWLDRYLTCFFNAWLDYQNLYWPNKKYCVAFCPYNLTSVKEAEHFFTYYPDGFRIQIIRNPLNWWASMKHYGWNRSKDIDSLFPRWLNAANVGIQLADAYPDKYLLVNFEELIQAPEVTMRKLCLKTGLCFDNIMLTPTINNIPRASNTSFGNGQHVVDLSATQRQTSLIGREIDQIHNMSDSLYHLAVSKCL